MGFEGNMAVQEDIWYFLGQYDLGQVIDKAGDG